MSKREGKTTKISILRKIEAILKEDINLAAELVFAKVEDFLEPGGKVENFVAGDIGYVHIDEKRQAEYLAWEQNIKQEWLATIESIREGIKKEQNGPLA